MKDRYLGLLRGLLSQNVVPFHEEAVAAHVRQWAAGRGVPVGADASGNLLLRYRKGRAKSKWVFAAHMDHPGFVARLQKGQTVQADFLGHVNPSYFAGAHVRFFAPGGPVVGTVKSAKTIPDTPWQQCQIVLNKPAAVPAGTIGMWNLPAMRVRGAKLISRACDDIVGCAAVIAALDEIIESKADGDVTVLLTRAEEAGFVGALAAVEEGTLEKDTFIVAIETSMAQPNARLGDGVVIRVGDRARTFDPTLTAHLTAVADGLAKGDKDFKFTRQLMPGGVCESTVYAIWGFAAAGLCIPLGNYHNQGRWNRIASEQVNLSDFESLVKLLAATAVSPATPADTDAKMRKRLEDMLKQRAKYLVSG